MSEFPAFVAGRGTKQDPASDRSDASRRPIYVETPPAHASIVSALRKAFGEDVRSHDTVDDELRALLTKLN